MPRDRQERDGGVSCRVSDDSTVAAGCIDEKDSQPFQCHGYVANRTKLLDLRAPPSVITCLPSGDGEELAQSFGGRSAVWQSSVLSSARSMAINVRAVFSVMPSSPSFEAKDQAEMLCVWCLLSGSLHRPSSSALLPAVPPGVGSESAGCSNSLFLCTTSAQR